MKLKPALIGATLLACTSNAQAVPFTLTPCTGGANTCPGATTEQQLFFNTGPNGTILGNVGSQNGTPVFTLTGDTSLAAQGFAQIAPGNGTLSTLTIAAPDGFGFSDLIFNVRGAAESIIATSGRNGDLELLTNGQNTFIALATSTALFTSLTLQAANAQFNAVFESLGQIRVSGLTALNPVPLPGALLLMGSVLAGVAGFGAARQRRGALA